MRVPESTSQDDVSRLLAFLSDRDVPCPSCRYNLRGLARPVCPECHQDLLLTVGASKPGFLWFLVTVTPCSFSAIAAALLLIPMTAQTVSGGGLPQWPIFALDAVGWLSALGGLVLIRYRYEFLRQPPSSQQKWAAVVWAAHVLAFLVMVSLIAVL